MRIVRVAPAHAESRSRRGMSFDKVRIRFRKDGDLRFVSHHDLMRAFERMLRRASLPFRSTEGFHPQPRLVFALSLPLGVSGLAEVLEIEWTETVEPDVALSRLNEQSPPGIEFLSAKRIDVKQTARVRRAIYRLAVPIAEIESLRNRCAKIAAAGALWVDRERPRPQQVNIRPYVNSLQCGPDHLEIDLWVTPEGSARADELVRELQLNHLLDAGTVLERIFLEIKDEIDPATASAAPALPSLEDRAAMVRPLSKPALPELRPESRAVHWGASPSGPIVE
jgi:radical SAM-linked protein